MGSRCQAAITPAPPRSSGLSAQVQPGGRRGEVAFVGAVRGIKALATGGPGGLGRPGPALRLLLVWMLCHMGAFTATRRVCGSACASTSRRVGPLGLVSGLVKGKHRRKPDNGTWWVGCLSSEIEKLPVML